MQTNTNTNTNGSGSGPRMRTQPQSNPNPRPRPQPQPYNQNQNQRQGSVPPRNNTGNRASSSSARPGTQQRERERGGSAAQQQRRSATQRVGVNVNGRARQAQGGQRRYSGSSDPVYIQRSFLLGKPVITRTTGTNLGVVNQMWVDTNAWKVVALDVRPNMFFGEMDSVMLDKLKQIGDVILVHDESDAQNHIVLYGLNFLIGSEVVTEVGGYLGKVRDFSFNPDDGSVVSIHFDSLGSPVIPSTVLSTYAVNCSEIISVGPDRIVVASGSESRVQQLSSGVMQRLALYEPPWEAAYRDQYDMDYYGYTLPPYEEQNTQQYRMQQPMQQQQQQYGSRYPPSRQQEQYAQRPVDEMARTSRPQQKYDDFIEVQEEQPVYEAQVQSQEYSDTMKYNKDEDRL